MDAEKTKPRGVIRPEDLYSQDGVMNEIGIGRNLLGEARRKGLVKPMYYGRNCYYLGADIIRLVVSESSSEPRNK